MSARGLRNRNSSRYSSPAVVADKSAEATPAERSGGKNGGLNTLERYWTEPPVRDGVPSFQDQGLERLGVLEHMAPLGALPTQKTLQKLKINGPRLSFRATTGTPVPQSEDAMTPATEIDRIEMPSPVDTEMHETPALISSPERGRPRKQDSTLPGEMQFIANMTPSPVEATFIHSNEPSPQSAISRVPAPEDVAFQLDKAIREAEHDGTRKLIPGLQKLREDVLTTPKLAALLDAVYRGSTTRKQFKKFKKYIKTGVRQYNSAPPSSSVDPALLPPFNNTAPAASPRHSLAQPGAFSFASRATSLPNNQPQQSNVPPIPKHHPSHLSHRSSPLKQTAEMIEENLVIDPALRTLPGGTPERQRSLSVASTSSLSSAPSVDERWRPAHLPPMPGESDYAVPVRSSGSRQAAKQKTRPSSTLPPSSDHPFAQFNNVSKFAAKKLKKPRVEESETDREAIEQRRHELRDQSYHDDYGHQRHESNLRPEMHSHPTSTTTILSNRIPTPVVHAHPLESSLAKTSHAHRLSSPAPAGPVANGTGRKRRYHEIDDGDAGLQTPRSTSPALLVPPPPGVAATSRAATPRAAKGAPPPSLKARKSARVMVS
jgi:hypothetical protein